MSTDKRAAYVAGLRDAATFIEFHPDLPVPDSASISLYPDGDDAEQRAEIDRIAKILDTEPETRAGGDHYLVVRHFGPVTYQATAITADPMTSYRAHMAGWSRGHE